MAKVMMTSADVSIEVTRGTILECEAFVEKHEGAIVDEKGKIYVLSVERA